MYDRWSTLSNEEEPAARSPQPVASSQPAVRDEEEPWPTVRDDEEPWPIVRDDEEPWPNVRDDEEPWPIGAKRFDHAVEWISSSSSSSRSTSTTTTNTEHKAQSCLVSRAQQ